MSAAALFKLEFNFEQVSEHLPQYWLPDHLLQSQHNFHPPRLFPPWTTWTRRCGAESVRFRTPSSTLLRPLLLFPEQPPHDPGSMCPRKRVTEVDLSSSMAESPQQEDALSTVSNLSNDPFNSVESRLGQISATLESLSTELAILVASRRGEGELLLKEVESPPMELVLEPKATKGGSVVESPGGFRKSSVVRLNVGGKVFHVSWELLQQVFNHFFHFNTRKGAMELVHICSFRKALQMYKQWLS